MSPGSDVKGSKENIDHRAVSYRIELGFTLPGLNTSFESHSISSINMSVQRTILQTIPIKQLPGWESRLVLLEFPPGVNGTLHNHPVPATGYVLEGDHVSQWEGGEIERYTAGDSFVDRAETLHVRTDNTNPDKWLRILLSYVIKVGEPNVVPQ